MKSIKEISENIKVFNIMQMGNNFIYALVKLPDCGTCTLLAGNNEDGMEHVSVSPRKKFRIPSWDDMCVLKDICWNDEEEVYQIMPKKSQYVNIVENCLHLWKPIGKELSDLKEV